MTRKEFLDATGISRQRLHQLMKGYWQVKNGKKYWIKPRLEEGKDFIIKETEFTEQALKKLTDTKGKRGVYNLRDGK